MRKIPILGLVGLVGTGLVAIPITQSPASAAEHKQAYVKREEHAGVLALATDDDDDDDTGVGSDTNTNTGTGAGTNTGTSTGTVVNHSRRGDDSQGARVRDMTRDGGKRHVDRSRHHTNDNSRHNTRG